MLKKGKDEEQDRMYAQMFHNSFTDVMERVEQQNYDQLIAEGVLVPSLDLDEEWFGNL